MREREDKDGARQSPNPRGWERKEGEVRGSKAPQSKRVGERRSGWDRESPYRGTDECIVKGRQKASLFELAAEEPSPFSTS